jgi:hypothetical protein
MIISKKSTEENLTSFLLTRSGATDYSLSYNGNIGIPITFASNALLLAHLNTYFTNPVYMVVNNIVTEFNLRAVYQYAITATIGTTFTFFYDNSLYSYNIVEANDDVVTAPIVLDSYDAVILALAGTIPAEGYQLQYKDVEFYNSTSETQLSVPSLHENLYNKIKDIPSPITIDVYSSLGFKMSDFTIPRWSEFADTVVSYTADEVICIDFDIDGADIEDAEDQDFLDSLEFQLVTPPITQNEESLYYRVETVIDGKTYDAIASGDIANNMRINHNGRNKAFMRAVFNKFRTLVSGEYELNANDIKIPLTLYYI